MGEKPTAEEELGTSSTGRESGIGSVSERISMQDLGGDSIAGSAGDPPIPQEAANLNLSKSNINSAPGGEGAAERRVVGEATEIPGPARPTGGPAEPGGPGPATGGGP
jgi:hypothetical protein